MKKIIDENGRLFGKISIIDVFVIVVALALIVAVAARRDFTGSSDDMSDLAPVEYNITLYATLVKSDEMVRVGDTVYDQSGVNVGTVKAVESKTAVISAYNAEGEYVLSEAEGRYDTVITVEAPAAVTNGRTYLNRTYEINVNSKREMYTKYYNFEAIITDIR